MSPEGEYYESSNVKQFAKEHNLTTENILGCLNNPKKIKVIKGGFLLNLIENSINNIYIKCF
jgi:hypothetical protein